ncbi:hypothetical protein N7532_004843 [Penicillium argentinense]|uniref:Uncharacterized protein n=1 Tax=Penicillium argentinense TaxID=1131581 RepID=A0A9W9FCX5_9EURO|nr:uncharacterized protein N7532_004843 [Penicillium argentinense]KAJ5097842.1 hypothetical protein N7532_004843 [Penicillium argentinense]
MKSAISIVSLLVATIAAAPLEARSVPTVTLALSNDQSGAYSTAAFAADGLDKSISSLFGSKSVGSSGHVLASSAQLSQFPGTISCTLKNNGAIFTLTAQSTYIDLDGNPGAATPVNLDNARVNCHV